jgi:hypothetical protein
MGVEETKKFKCVRGKERLFCVFASPKNLDLFVKKSSDGELVESI